MKNGTNWMEIRKAYMPRPHQKESSSEIGRIRRLPALIATVLGLAIVVAAGCGGSKPAAVSKETPAAQGPAKTPSVTTVLASTREVSATVQATGSFVAKDASDVAPEIAGRIVETPVNVGDFVKEGQVIAHMENRDATLKLEQAVAAETQAEAAVRQAESRIGLGKNQDFDVSNVPEVLSAKAAYESAEAQARLAQADSKRYENLVNTGDVSRSAYDKAKTQADTAVAQANSARQQFEATQNNARQNYQGVATSQASLAGVKAATSLARKALEDTIIRAPFSGYVSARPVAAGEYVALTAKIATVLRITPIKLELQVPEGNAPQVRLGLTVQANVPGYPGRDFAGKVTAINPSVDQNSRTFTVEAEFPNQDIALKPGMFATGRVYLPGLSQGVFLPRQVIVTDPSTNSSQVFVIREGKAHLAVVQLGEQSGDFVRILSGVAGDAVVASNHLQDLYDGQAVESAPPKSETQASPAKPPAGRLEKKNRRPVRA